MCKKVNLQVNNGIGHNIGTSLTQSVARNWEDVDNRIGVFNAKHHNEERTKVPTASASFIFET